MVGSVDDRIAVWVATHRYAPLDDVFVRLGTIERLGAVWIALAVVLAVVTRRGAAGGVLLVASVALATFAADAASFAVKDVVERPRPFEAHPQIHPLYVVHSTSFPAGHAATAFAGATVLSRAAPRLAPAFAFLAAAIGFSRVYVGDHYPGDVVGGAMLGALVGLAVLAAPAVLRGVAERHRQRKLTRRFG